MMLLSTENLSKKYGRGEAQIVALDRVSISVEKGEFVSVMGASGSGKSTLLNLLGGLDDPTEGRVLYYNTDLEQMENIFDRNDEMLSEFRLRTAGFIFQSYNLVPELTVRENILLPRAIAMEEQEDDRMAEIVERLGLSDRLDYLPWQLSGGQQQRTAIARALVNQPEILLCDEPTGNLDSRSGEKVMELLKMLNSEYKITIIMITHDPLLAGQTTRTIRISDGRIV
ncbi:MAG: ABC transporter ATP-binding protein [Lachnospiraceae bacterium]|nr:ABC transporter ATP-binding protein [Lachnospiraceae bacterium]